jgi:hypothetical protein
MIRRVAAILALLVLVSMTVPTRVIAADRKETGGVIITPALQQLVITEDQPKLEGFFTVQNDADQPTVFELSAIDMGTLDDTGGLIFSGLSQDYQKKHGLAQWIELPQTRLEIAPQKVATVAFTIKNESTLSPGGHYGAIIVKQVPKQPGQANQQVNLSPQAASLLFLLKRGGEVYQLGLQQVKAAHTAWTLPAKVELPFKNEGNVHIVPRGIVRLKDIRGRELARGIINPDSAIVLPDRTRTLQVPFNNLPRIIWPGRYTVEVEYRYDGQETFSRYTEVFYAANLRVLVIMIVTVAVLGWLAYRFRTILWKLFKLVKSALKALWRRLPILLRHLTNR